MTPAVVTPMRVEQLAVTAGLRTAAGLPAGAGTIRTGMGRARAARVAATLAGRPRLVVGVAGGTHDSVRPGDVVVADRVIDGDIDGESSGDEVVLACAPMLAGALRRAGLRVHVGTVATTTRVAGAADRRRLAAAGVLAVDTESLELARGSDPAAVVRVVVDTAEEPLLRLGTAVRGVRALATLRRAAPVLADWAAACGPRTVDLASPRSFCAGVERAITIVERGLERYGAPLYVRRQIVHNTHVVADLEAQGARFVHEVDEVPPGSRVVLAAHGVTPAVRAQADARGLQVIDATCPLVAKVHAEVRRYAARGDTVFLVGHGEHEEVEGTVGEAPDRVVVVADAAEATTVTVPDPRRVAYVMQTTLAIDEAEQVAGVLRQRFPTLVGPPTDDICYATTNRQQAVQAVARPGRLVLVVGSANSSNSQRLVEVAQREGSVAHLVDDVAEVELTWLAGARHVAVTAGASAPPHLVSELLDCLAGFGELTVEHSATVEEDVRFSLPREVN